MSTTASQQLEEIHSMMASGHRSIRMERHTLIFWGLAAAFLILTTEQIFTTERFPVVWQLIVAMNLYISFILFVVAVADFRLTRKLRQERGESVSFVQRQLAKVWWLLVGLVVVINISMNFFDGGQLFYGICMILIGLALYIHGLFSQQMLTWGGIMLIMSGLACTAFTTSYGAQKYLAASVFGIGLPLLSEGAIIEPPLVIPEETKLIVQNGVANPYRGYRNNKGVANIRINKLNMNTVVSQNETLHIEKLP